MALKNAIEEYRKRLLPNDECSLGRILNSLPKEDKDALEKAMLDNLSGKVIVDILRSEGYKISKDTYYTHQRGLCKCQQKKS